tara:strand:+ start:221 stop:586 length:366 start_codon:yes stop_codon:yes gene_type:complete
MNIKLLHAFTLLYPNANFRWETENGEYLFKNLESDVIGLTEEELLNKKEELQNAEPMRLLRVRRNNKLAETDWTQNRDITLSNDTDWKTYRQALRDLPSTASPKLDEEGNLTNVTWPTKPE